MLVNHCHSHQSEGSLLMETTLKEITMILIAVWFTVNNPTGILEVALDTARVRE